MEKKILIIDEKPPIAINKVLTRKDLYTVYLELNKIGEESKLFGEASTLRQYIDQINLAIASLDCFKRLKPIEDSYHLPTALRDYYSILYEGDDIESIALIASIIRNGGIVKHEANTSTWQEGKIFTIERNDYGKEIKTVIFDATAIYDLEYSGSSYRILDIPPIRRYENFYINNCPEMNLSRACMNNPAKELNFDVLLCDLNIKNKKAFLLTYKNQKNAISKIIEDRYGNSSNICMGHYNNVRGKNDFVESDLMLAYGMNYLGDEFYLAKAMALEISLKNMEFTREHKARISKDDDLNRIMCSDMFCDLVQSILRTKLRRNTKDVVQFYSFIPYCEIIAMLKDYFVDCNIMDWYPDSFYKQYHDNGSRTKKPTNVKFANLLERRFSNLNSQGAMSISKMEVKDALGYTCQNTFANHLNSEYVKCKLQQLGVTVGHHNLIKINNEEMTEQ
ncbi:MAG: hypothetical protein H6Q60_6 [Oscillospiraceae bacterium]|nr:hypothetical protein [Oscillospiraceae bacterium]